MKAFKQIDLSFEKRIVFSYSAIVAVFSFFIMLSPLFAQDVDSTQSNPKIHWDVKKQLDKNGNITSYDSVYSWEWNGNNLSGVQMDSLFRNFDHHFRFFGDQGNLGFNHFEPLMPPNGDSTLAGNPDSSFFKHFGFSPDFFNFNMPGDSLGISFFDFNDLGNFFNNTPFDFPDLNGGQLAPVNPGDKSLEPYRKSHEDFMKRYNEYLKEHQKLIEKYFGNPAGKNDTIQNAKPNKYLPQDQEEINSKSGKI